MRRGSNDAVTPVSRPETSGLKSAQTKRVSESSIPLVPSGILLQLAQQLRSLDPEAGTVGLNHSNDADTDTVKTN